MRAHASGILVTISHDPFDRVVAALRTLGCRVKPRHQGESVRATCPAHDDQNPSLLVTKYQGKSGKSVTVKCFGGCSKVTVLKALGLTYGDLYYTRASE